MGGSFAPPGRRAEIAVTGCRRVFRRQPGFCCRGGLIRRGRRRAVDSGL